MNRILYISLLFAAVNCFYIDNATNGSSKDKIVGGEYIDIEEVPYLAQILRYGQQICGGTIISKRWILTAAHCMEVLNDISVVVGTSKQSKGGKRIDVKKIIVHENYDIESVDNDIALLLLSEPIVFNKKQKPIRITKEKPSLGDVVKISGFGKEGDYLPDSETVKAATVKVVDTDKCTEVYAEEGDKITDNMFCAARKDTDTCQGDSGGPAVVNNILVGIVSFGMDCADPNFPGVYTQLYNYRAWIKKNTGLKL